ncbi:MAG TPA: hypothetical protein VFK24_04030 [Gammaproteobacteria bacterium]|nr:hypothetical protein [Gammaproteobacteria bacterium]
MDVATVVMILAATAFAALFLIMVLTIILARIRTARTIETMAPAIDVIRWQADGFDNAPDRRDFVIRARDAGSAQPPADTRRHYGIASGTRSAQR